MDGKDVDEIASELEEPKESIVNIVNRLVSEGHDRNTVNIIVLQEVNEVLDEAVDWDEEHQEVQESGEVFEGGRHDGQ